MKNIFSTFVFLLASQQVLAQQPFQTFDMIVTDPAGVVAAMNNGGESHWSTKLCESDS